jgi:hypothetical protein
VSEKTAPHLQKANEKMAPHLEKLKERSRTASEAASVQLAAVSEKMKAVKGDDIKARCVEADSKAVVVLAAAAISVVVFIVVLITFSCC